jgi:transposase-like protein
MASTGSGQQLLHASARRDTEAARRFFQQARTGAGVVPVEVITDRAPTYPRVLGALARRVAWRPTMHS